MGVSETLSRLGLRKGLLGVIGGSEWEDGGEEGERHKRKAQRTRCEESLGGLLRCLQMLLK